jgi:hypothetical protein
MRANAAALNTRRVQRIACGLPSRVWLSTAITWQCRVYCRANFVFLTGVPRKLHVNDMSERLASQLAW